VKYSRASAAMAAPRRQHYAVIAAEARLIWAQTKRSRTRTVVASLRDVAGNAGLHRHIPQNPVQPGLS
jgi:hypothetical protein